MEKIKNYEELRNNLDTNDRALVFVTNDMCSVCHADLPRIDELAKKKGISAYHVDIAVQPLIAGQFSLFSVPAVLLFFKGKEYHRQVHFIDFRELEHRIEEIMEAPLEELEQ